ncbi:MAG: hypothetical protein KF893_01400 [Caldilineaceae bacterium]|nr:hypothetical protein [Caldilineaceae bacterium]
MTRPPPVTDRRGAFPPQIAAALRHPSVVISLTDEQERWNPLDLYLHRVGIGYHAASVVCGRRSAV